jgi:uncharacterized protein YecE (DUF72 family)
LYSDLRARVPAKKSVYAEGVGDEVLEEGWELFLSALRPLYEAGGLGALLFRFPPWFAAGERGRAYILRVGERCAPVRVCVEFRNETWLSPENAAATLEFLRRNDLVFVGVDVPQGHLRLCPSRSASGRFRFGRAARPMPGPVSFLPGRAVGCFRSLRPLLTPG